MTITDDKLELSSTDRAGAATASSQPNVRAVRTRRSPSWVAIFIVLTLLGGVFAYMGITAASNSTKVWIAKTPITRGHTIVQEDLDLISISNGQETKAIPESKVADIRGKIAVADIPAGGLITSTSIASKLGVPDGKALVGITLVPGRLPSQTLVAGDDVVLVPVPIQGGQPVAVDQNAVIPAVVSQVHPIPNTANVVVDVIVSSQKAADVTSKSAAGALALYLTPQESK